MSKSKQNHQSTQKTMSPPALASAPVAQAKPAPAPVAEAKPIQAPAPVAQAKPASKPASNAPSYEEIARRAYELYQRRGAQPGRAGDDWLQAERELSSHAAP